jgi:hypothetical protein
LAKNALAPEHADTLGFASLPVIGFLGPHALGDEAGPIGRFEILTYGVRRRQVCTLKLQDIDWQERRVTFVGIKGGKAVTHVQGVLDAVTAMADASGRHATWRRSVLEPDRRKWI